MKILATLLIIINMWGLGNIADKILFVVDDQPVLISDYVYYISLKSNKKIDKIPDDMTVFRDFEKFFLLSREAEKKGYGVSSAELERDRKILSSQMGLKENQMFDYVEKKLGIPKDSFIKLRKIFILDNYLLSSVLQSVKVSNEEIENYYNQNKDKYKSEVVKVMLISSEKNVTPKKKYKYNEIISTFPDAVTQINYIKRGEYPNFEAKLFSASKGTLIGPIKSDRYYNYFYIIKAKSKQSVPLSVLSAKIREKLLERKREKMIETTYNDILKEHYIRYCFGVNNGKINFNDRGSCGDRSRDNSENHSKQ